MGSRASPPLAPGTGAGDASDVSAPNTPTRGVTPRARTPKEGAGVGETRGGPPSLPVSTTPPPASPLFSNSSKNIKYFLPEIIAIGRRSFSQTNNSPTCALFVTGASPAHTKAGFHGRASPPPPTPGGGSALPPPHSSTSFAAVIPFKGTTGRSCDHEERERHPVKTTAIVPRS